jgi:hypothetical protein
VNYVKKKQIYLHIGTTKTGTTTIQAFLEHNREVLKQKNFSIYVPEGLSGDRIATRLRTIDDFIIESRQNNAEHLNTSQQVWVNNLIERIKHTNTDNVILSEELFWNAMCTPFSRKIFDKFIMELRRFAHITVIVYFRRQDLFLMSEYQNGLRNGRLKVSGNDCEQWLTKYIKRADDVSDYKTHLKPIISLFGKGNVIVRPFEKEQFIDQSLLADFMHLTGLQMSDEFEVVNTNRNPGLSPFLAEIMRYLSINDSGKAPASVFISPKNESNDKLFNVNKQHDFLPPKARIDLMKRYKKGNEWIARKFLDRKDGILFRESLPDIDEPWEKYQLNSKEVKAFFDNAYFIDKKQRQIMRNRVLDALNESSRISIKRFVHEISFKVLPLRAGIKWLLTLLPGNNGAVK